MQLDIALESKIGPTAIKELGLLAETYGIRTVWIQNLARAPDAFMAAVPLALASSTIKVGIAVVCSHEMHPLKIANAALTLNEYSKGRAGVVVTSGGEWPGVIGKKIAEVARTKEALEIIKASLGNEPNVSYEGDFYKAQMFNTKWKTQSPPTLYGGAHRAKMMQMIATTCDALMFSDIQPEMFDGILGTLNTVRPIEDRPNDFRLSNFIAWHIKENREASLWEAQRELIIRAWLYREWIEPYLEPEEVEWVLKNPFPFLKAYRERTGDIEGVSQHIVDQLVEGLTMSGDPSDIDRHIERLEAFKREGFTEISLGLQEDPVESIKMIGEQVLPAIQ